MAMRNQDFYKILGVEENASTEAIKKAYRRLAKENHPDTHPGDKRAEERFKEISEAYSVLSDPKKRQQYDQMRRFGFAGAGQGGGFSAQGFDFDLSDLFQGAQRTGPRRTTGQPSLNLDELFGFGGIGDLFSQIFSRDNGFHQQSSTMRQGNDIRVNLELPFKTAVLGGKATFSIMKDELCTHCKGTGSANAKSPARCPECNGSGMISRVQGAFSVNRPCPRCLGKGRVIMNPCKHCAGSGRIKKAKKYTMKIAPGSEDGKKIRLPGQGNPGEAGAPAGDLIVQLKVASHRFFWNKGLDVYCEVPIDRQKAQKGTKVRVKTIHGNSVELKIPPNSNGGKTFRLKGMGARNDQTAGEQYVKIKIK